MMSEHDMTNVAHFPDVYDDRWEPVTDVPEDVERARAAEEPLPTIRLADLEGVEIPPRQWVVKGWLPANAVTLIAGGGGVGKSLMTQQLLTAISLGLNWLGMETVAAVPTLFVNCEDEMDEIARRNVDIAEALGFKVGALKDAHVLSRAGALGNELGTFDGDRKFVLSAFFHQITRAAKEAGCKVVGLDNIAHLFTGNENVRSEVTQFVNACNRLAMEIGGAVVLLGHPAKIEDSQYSGSTAWENSVRSRLFLQRPKVEQGQDCDPNERILTRGKSNYAAKDEAVQMVWHRGAFVERSMVPEVESTAYEVAGKWNALFLECLDDCNRKQRNVSHNSRASNYAPKLFAAMPGGARGNKAIFAAAMERLIAGEIIKIDQPLWLGNDRKPVFGIARVG
jgi:RecA-family ATPase